MTLYRQSTSGCERALSHTREASDFKKRKQLGVMRVSHLKGILKQKNLSHGLKRAVSRRALSSPLPHFHSVPVPVITALITHEVMVIAKRFMHWSFPPSGGPEYLQFHAVSKTSMTGQCPLTLPLFSWHQHHGCGGIGRPCPGPPGPGTPRPGPPGQNGKHDERASISTNISNNMSLHFLFMIYLLFRLYG